MTDTTPAAVERHILRIDPHGQAQKGSLNSDTFQILRALSAQLEAANQRAEMLADSVAKARAEGRAEGLREAADALKSKYQISSFWVDGNEVFGADAGTPAACYQTILALIPADTPAKVTVQEAARLLLDDETAVTDLAIDIVRANRLIEGQRIGVHPALIIALRTIAGGRDE